MIQITYEIKSKVLLTKNELKQLDTLHYSDGLCFKQLKNKFKLGIVILAKDDSNKILGWGLIFERSDCEVFLYIYIAKSHRKLGIGREIYVQAVLHFGNTIQVSRHNSTSKKFYDSVGAAK